MTRSAIVARCISYPRAAYIPYCEEFTTKMKNVMMLAGAMLLLTSVAFAGPDKAKGKKTAAKTEIGCAIMGAEDKVNIKKATADKMFADYNGNRYFFCCPGCKPKFNADPAKYAKSESVPTPKANKKSGKAKG